MKRDPSEFLPKVNIAVMLCHNALELTKRAVESVLAQDIPVHLVAVDNNSIDGTTEWLLQQERVTVHTFRPALGVSAGWNFALVGAFRQTDHVLVVNNDVVLRPDTYRELIADGGDFVTAVSVGEISGIQTEFVKSVRPHPDFSCFMIRREVWNAVGAFDENMVLYASDADYHLRMYKLGFNAYTIGIPFYHYASGTLKSASQVEAQQIRFQADRDRDTFERKWHCRVGSKEYYDLFGSTAP